MSGIDSAWDEVKGVDMHEDLAWLARNVSEWGSRLGAKHILKSGNEADYVLSHVDSDGFYRGRKHKVCRCFTRAQWQAARKQLGLDDGMKRGKTEAETLALNGWKVGDILQGDEGNGPDRILITAIGEDRFTCKWDYKCTGEYQRESGNTTLSCREWRKVGYRVGLGDGGWSKKAIDAAAFTTPEEDEAWQEKERQQNQDKYSAYFKDVRHINTLDVYRVVSLFDCEKHGHPISHAAKKLLLSGSRTGGKGVDDDVREAIDTLHRWLEMREEDARALYE